MRYKELGLLNFGPIYFNSFTMWKVMRQYYREVQGEEVHFTKLSNHSTIILKKNDKEDELAEAPYIIVFPANENNDFDYVVLCKSKEFGEEFMINLIEGDRT